MWIRPGSPNRTYPPAPPHVYADQRARAADTAVHRQVGEVRDELAAAVAAIPAALAGRADGGR